jgi:transcriptional regulator with XRE-family HTH domain
MKSETKNKSKNNLHQIRKRRGLEGKQVAFLLGHKSPDEVYRYERGDQEPKLKNAMKLEIIYQMPVKLLFQKLYEECRADVSRLKKERPQLLPDYDRLPKNSELLTYEESCFYANLLQGRVPNQLELETVQKHVINLIRTVSDFKNGRLPFS